MEHSLGRFGDERLRKGGDFLLDRLITHGQSGVRVRPLGGSRAGEVRLGRFLRNPNVTPAEMVSTAAARTARRVEGEEILVIQDTTTLRDDGNQNSLNLHVAIAINARDGPDWCMPGSRATLAARGSTAANARSMKRKAAAG